MTKSLNPRVELEIRKAIEQLAADDWTLSETAKKLIHVGIAVREAGEEPEIEGPFGLPRPFAKISLGDTMVELRTEIDESLEERLTAEFDNKPNTAAREALRLGVISVFRDQLRVRGPEGAPRPFAEIRQDMLTEPTARKLLKQMRNRI